MFRVLLSLLFILLDVKEALAYIGPGLSAGTIGAILGIIGSVFLALLAVIYYPIKRLFRKRKRKKADVRSGIEL